MDALKVSSDTYFFTVGKLANEHGGEVIQRKAHELGVGEPTGIDLPSEFPGVVPSRAWLAQQNRLEAKCTREHHGQPCYIVAEPGAPWTVGYNMDLAVGQGELLTDPLQMAVAYSTLANAYRNGGNGTVVTPHLGKQIDEPNHSLLQTLRFPSRARAPQLRRPEPRDGGHPRGRQRARGAPPPKCGPAGTRKKIRYMGRPAPPNARGTWNSPGTCATSATRSTRS